MSISSTYIGQGTYLSSSYYLRNYYTANRSARSSSTRSEYSTHELSLADSQALRRAIKRLGSFEYDDDDATNVRNSVSAFVSTYNNMMESLSSSDDSTLTRTLREMKSLTSEYADDLDDLGVTVNSDGTLTGRDALLSAASISKFQELFSSDSNYMQRINSYSKRIERQSESLVYKDRTDKLRDNQASNSSQTDSSETTAVATLVTEGLTLTGTAPASNSTATGAIGGSVNVAL